ncbi:MAG: hypothetical protein HY866_20305 [Chloroflexi bacterium]|nr:hypothetical protein [Chloroflexota bacterium]
MDSLTREALTALLETEGEWCVSVLLPTMRTGTEVQQNPIRFKNLVREAENQLAQLNVRTPDIETLLKPAHALLNDAEIWRQMGDGMAFFSAPGYSSALRLPVHFDELVVVKRRFHLKPLLELLSNDGQFFVLALSQDRIRLLEGTRHSVSELDLTRVPESLSAALEYERPSRALRMAPVGLHGFGGGEEEETKLDILRYFKMVDKGVRDLFGERRAPLVLAGVDYLLPIYREANTYPHLLDGGLTGSPEALNAKELHQRAWEVVKPYFEKNQKEQADLFLQLAGQNADRASTDLKQVVQAAHEGRIAALFVARGVQEWGVYRAHSHNVHVHPTQQPGDHDLLDLAAVQTFASGGDVYIMDQDGVPGGQSFAAIFRY